MVNQSATMQAFTSTQCDNMAEHERIALYDNRDNNVYSVTKLKDGNCWMTSNLALNLADFAGTHNLTVDNTDLPSREADPSGPQYWDPSESMKTLAENMLSEKNGNPESSITIPDGITAITQDNYFRVASLNRLGTEQIAQFQSGNQYGNSWHWGSKFNESGAIITSRDNCTVANSYCWQQGSSDVWIENNSKSEMPRSYDNGGANSYGGYYNYYAATTETGKFDMTGNATDSICPKGWQLPIDGNSTVDKSWTKLLYGSYTTDGSTPLADNADSSTVIRQLPLSLAYTGYYNLMNVSLNNRGSVGYFWSSTVNSKWYSRGLYFNSSNVYPLNNYTKPNGYTVRCVKFE